MAIAESKRHLRTPEKLLSHDDPNFNEIARSIHADFERWGLKGDDAFYAAERELICRTTPELIREREGWMTLYNFCKIMEQRREEAAV